MIHVRLLLALASLAAMAALTPVTGEAADPHPEGPPPGWQARPPFHVGRPDATDAPTGLSPDVIKRAYNFSTSLTAGEGTTIAIVDAYDNPNAEADLGVFSNQYGLPACTTANGCFKKVNQSGKSSYPRPEQNWALEISLDIQWAHAIAPGAKILLVEASSNTFTNLMAAVDYAKKNADYVSMSWGGSEFSSESRYDSHFRQKGVSFFAASGDAGTPAEYPSASPNVISVGGTRLVFDAGGNLVDETGWSGSGGGCSAYENKNAAQTTGSVNCAGKRATPDVSLDADPASGVSIYDSYGFHSQQGWFKVGGTSVSTPIWAARAATADVVVDAAYVYGDSIPYRDITSGASDGASCLPGYDLVTGRGSWVDPTP